MGAKIVKTDMPFPVFSIEADRDYLLARLIAFLGGGFHSRAGYLGQQACEKYLKALSVQHDGTYSETHKLLELAAYAEPNYEFLKRPEAKTDLEKFDAFEQVGRYGGAANFDPLSKGRPVAGSQTFPTPELQMAGTWFWTPGHLVCLDRAVFNLRGCLNFAKANYDDGIASILADNQRSSLVGAWSGPIPIKEVLTRENAYFRKEALKPAPQE